MDERLTSPPPHPERAEADAAIGAGRRYRVVEDWSGANGQVVAYRVVDRLTGWEGPRYDERGEAADEAIVLEAQYRIGLGQAGERRRLRLKQEQAAELARACAAMIAWNRGDGKAWTPCN